MKVSDRDSWGAEAVSWARTRTPRADADRTKDMMKGRWAENHVKADSIVSPGVTFGDLTYRRTHVGG